VCLEVFCSGIVATDFHKPQLIPLPDYVQLSAPIPVGSVCLDILQHTVEIRGAHKGDVYAEITMVGRAVQTEIYGEGNGSPCWILCAAVKTYLFHICQWVGAIQG
jgi:hypothetical protein